MSSRLAGGLSKMQSRTDQGTELVFYVNLILLHSISLYTAYFFYKNKNKVYCFTFRIQLNLIMQCNAIQQKQNKTKSLHCCTRQHDHVSHQLIMLINSNLVMQKWSLKFWNGLVKVS